jgi:PAS domain S-box-containing protein
MEEAKMTYEDLLIKVKDQEFKIQEIEKDLAAQKNILNEVKNNIMASSFSIYSLSIKNDGSLFYNYIYGAVDRVYGLDFTNKDNVNSLVLERIHEKDKENLLNSIYKAKSDLTPLNIEYRYFHPQKGMIWHEINSTFSVNLDGSSLSYGVVTDITQRMLTEQKMNKAIRLFQFISCINQIIVRTHNKEELFKEVCDVAVEVGQFKMAWIGMIDFDTQNIVSVSANGDDLEYLSNIKTISVNLNGKAGKGPAGNAIKLGNYQVCNAIEDDPIMEPWRAEALKSGFQSLIAIPIKMFDSVIGIFVIYSSEKNYFDEEEIKLLDKAAADVTFALEIFEKEKMRKLAEEAVAESEKRFHTLTEVSPVGIYRTDLTGATTYVNQRWTEIVGISFEQSMGSGWYIAVHPEDQLNLYNEWKKVTREKVRSILEYRFIKPDGSIVWVIGQAAPETNADNEIIGFIGTITDITDRKQAQDRFVVTNKKMEAIIEAIPDLMFEIDLKGNIFNYHSSTDDLLLMAPSQFIGKNISQILPSDALALCLLALDEAGEKGFSRGKQYSLDLPIGKCWFELSLAPMKEDESEELHFIVISRDITEQKKADEALVKNKERYRGLLDNLEAGIVVHNCEGNIIMCNSIAAELLGYSIEQLMSGNKELLKWNFLNEDYSEMLFENYPINQILNSKIAIKNFPLGIKDAIKGTIVWILVSGFPMLDEKGDIQEVVVSFIDVTEQNKMNYEIQKAKELAESANKSKTDFLANMSHEIRTPLNGIIGFTSLLMETQLEENQQKHMLTINESANTLMHIVNDILDFSKIEAGKLDLKTEEIDFFALINQVISLFQYQAIQKEIELKSHIDADVPQFLITDPLRLKQIIINLIGNAIKFTQKGKIQLEVQTILPLEEHFVNLSFAVKDTGIGIKEQNQAKIFHSFVQEDNSTSRQFGGTGLGLAISNQLLALMNSTLHLESTYGEGSKFYFDIRLKKSEIKNPTQIKINNMSIIKSVLGAKKVLIVEDNAINMFLAKTLIRKIIPESIISEAYDGDEAIEQYKEQQPNIILMDIQMPNKNGFEATDEIRKIEKDRFTPIIALTAGIFVEEKEQCLKSGMNDYITKPINVADLEAILLKWLSD